MPELIAKSALDGRRLTLGGLTLVELDPGPITSVALYPGGAKLAAKGLKTLGLTFPPPNTFTEKKGARIVWTGREQAFLMGVAPPAIEGAALTDQSDGWAVLGISGAAAVDVLARLVPVDLRSSAFPAGRVARTQVNHMNAVILRTGDHELEIMVFRSMARTAWHELEGTISMVAARQAVKI
ncbi:sarcosine oxidase subunit gamma [Tabrizicola caldifontis]|uniref:sarcosine oxidase subunit gamma n=1 Tax=Tabrizicola caldifontis TaxID=2528036 RepID=UPI001081579A|nr:sarcosine oxidase subunit gamma family protein [Rhodobacter sp. YIM 73028]